MSNFYDVFEKFKSDLVEIESFKMVDLDNYEALISNELDLPDLPDDLISGYMFLLNQIHNRQGYLLELVENMNDVIEEIEDHESQIDSLHSEVDYLLDMINNNDIDPVDAYSQLDSVYSQLDSLISNKELLESVLSNIEQELGIF